MSYDSFSYRLFRLFNTGFLIVIVIIMLFPYLNVLAYSLNDGLDSQFGNITIFPRVPTLENFRVLLSDPLISRAFVVSVARVVVGTLFALVVQFSCAYAFTMKGIRGKKFILLFLMFPMYFGGGIIPIYLLYSKLHLLNNFLVYVLPVSFSLYNMVIIRSYLYSIPESMGESAKLDGANEITIMIRIYIPLAKPILAVITLWTAVNHWNDWVTTLYYVTNSKYFTLQFVLMQVLREGERIAQLLRQAIEMGIAIGEQQQAKMTPQALKAAQIILTSLPIVLVYPFLQKYFVKGITLGAVKE